MAIHIDIYAHLRKRELIKEGEELKRYVDSLEKDANKRLLKGAQGRTRQIIRLNDAQARSYDVVINATDAYTAATVRHGKAVKALASLKKQTAKTDKDQEKLNEAIAAGEREVTEAMVARAYAAQQLTKSVNDETRARKDLNKENRAYNKITKDNKKDLRDLLRITNTHRRDLQNLHTVNLALIKDDAAAEKQMKRVGEATKRTTKERKKYTQMVRDGTSTAKQLRDQTERIIEAHEREREVIGDVTGRLNTLIGTHKDFNQVVSDNRARLTAFNVSANAARASMQNLAIANRDAIHDSRGVASAFNSVSEATIKARREHKEYDRMIQTGSASKETLIRKSESVADAYRREGNAVSKAAEEVRRFRDAEKESAARRVAGTGGRGGGPGGHMRFDPGRWAARNLGALTPLGMVTPTLVLPLGTAFVQVANAAVAASQSIALLPAVATAAGAAFGTLQMATAGFGDAVTALASGDLQKFNEQLQILSPSAQQAALTLQNLWPQLQGMQRAAQEAFFKNTPQLMFSLTKTLGPVIETMTTDIATSMNNMMMNVGNLLLSPEGMADVQVITQNIASAFQSMEPAVTAVAEAFLDLTSVGSELLPGMADDIAEVARSFANFIGEARDSGALRDFMTQGWEAIKAVGSALVDFGKMLYDVFGLKSQADIQEFRQTMQEMTDVVELVLRTLKTFFEDIASAFSGASNTFSQFGISLESISTVLARIAEAWLFIHFLKWGADALSLLGKLNIALTGTAAAAGAAGAAGATGGLIGSATTAATALGRMIQPLTAIAAIAALIEQSAPNFPMQDQPTGQNRIFPGWFPILPAWEENIRRFLPGGEGPPAAPPTPGQEAPGFPGRVGGTKKIRNKTTGQTAEIPGAQDPPVGWEEVPGGGAHPGVTPLVTPGEVPYFNVPNAPLPGQDFQSTPGTFELANIPVGTFPGAQWNVPPGLMDLPPDYQNLGKTGYYRPDPYKIFQAQGDVDQARTRVEEARIKALATQADANHTQDQLNKDMQNVIEAERGWIDAQRDLKIAERGEFEDLTSQTRKFSDDLRDSLGDMGAALDPDLGISKGLAGLADNLVKFVATLGAAPVLGAMKGMQAGYGFPGNKGVGSGLIGIWGAQHGYYESPYDQQDLMQLQQAQQYGMVTVGPYGSTPAMMPPGMPGAPTDPISAYAQRFSGGKYDWGSSNLAQGLSDCSGAVSDLVEILTQGTANSGRLFNAGPSTGADLAALGAVPGAIPGALQIGWSVGGPGGGHMRATLPNGMPFESGGGTGGGATYGPPAQGAAGMPNIMSFPMQGYTPSPGYSSSSYALPPGQSNTQTGLTNPVPNDSAWNPLMQAESAGSGEWQANTGNGYYGGLQFDQATWEQYGGTAFAPSANQAPSWAQIAVARVAMRARGGPQSLWPTNWQLAPPPGFDEGGMVGRGLGGSLIGGGGQGHSWGGRRSWDPYGMGIPSGKSGWPLIGANTPWVDLDNPPGLKPLTPLGTLGAGIPKGANFNPNMKIDTSTVANAPWFPWQGWQGSGGRYQTALQIASQNPTLRLGSGADIIDAMTTNALWGSGFFHGHARGGSVDNTLIRATPGEFVVNKSATQRFGPLLEHINSYDKGGEVKIPPGMAHGGAQYPGEIGGNLQVTKPPPYPGTTPQAPLFPPPAAPPAAPPPGAAPGPEGVPHLPGVPHLGPGPTLPGPVGVPTPETHVGAQIEPYQGYGEGFNISGGIIGALVQGAAGAAGGLIPGGGAAASAALQIGIEEIQRAIEFGAQAAGIGVQGLMETFLPTGGSQLANENWLTRIVGGIVGATPNLPNLAGGMAGKQPQFLPGVGPATPEQVVAQQMDPNRTVHTGVGPPPGPVTTNGIGYIENYNVTSSADAAMQDAARYIPIKGAR